MAGGMSIGAGEGLLGGTLGGIGDIISAVNYKKPVLKPASGMELRLRQLAQAQLLGGGQETLGGTALYNQMAPILMSQLPGMRYVPPTQSLGGVGDTSTGGGAAGGGSPGQNYQTALGNYQQQQNLQQQLTALKAQIKGTKPGGGRLKGLNQQQKQLQHQLKSLPSAQSLQRQEYLSGTQPDASLYNISMAPSGGGIRGASSAGLGDQGQNLGMGGGSPSLASIQGLMDGMSGTPHPDFLSQYYGAAGGQPGGTPYANAGTGGISRLLGGY